MTIFVDLRVLQRRWEVGYLLFWFGRVVLIVVTIDDSTIDGSGILQNDGVKEDRAKFLETV